MKQIITAKLKLHPTPEQFAALRRTQLAYRDALNYVSQYAFAHGKTSNKIALQDGTYTEIRARYHLRTGYRDGTGGVSYPSMGSVVASEIGDRTSDLPSFVAMADRRDRSHGPGYLGTGFQPLYVHDPAKGVENLKAPATVRKSKPRRKEFNSGW